jgi:hypothetical protein
MINAALSTISTDLLAYGEEDASAAVLHMTPAEHERLANLAADILYAPNSPRLLSYCVAMAAIHVLEGRPRSLKRKKRLMHVYGKSSA